MPILETFSKRQKRLQQDAPFIYQYDDLPQALRVQIVRIINRALGDYAIQDGFSVSYSPTKMYWDLIQERMCDELGVFALTNLHQDHATQCRNFILQAETRGVLDIVELMFRVIDRGIREKQAYYEREANVTQDADSAIAELNHRFQEHGFGYKYEAGQLLRIDSQYLHAEAVEPALRLLHENAFQGASDEFLSAHKHLQKGEYKDAISDALNAFESTMKTICDLKMWHYEASKATAKDLIQVLLQNGLLPTYLQEQLTALRLVLESGVPTVRNKTSGHGQGSRAIAIPERFAIYALHMTAANILFLVESYKDSLV